MFTQSFKINSRTLFNYPEALHKLHLYDHYTIYKPIAVWKGSELRLMGGVG